jgi:hypothetical protein
MMAENTFRHPRSWGWRLAISTPVWLLGGGGMLWISTAAPLVFAIPLALVGAFGVVSPFVKVLMWASSISVTEEGIEAVTYARTRTRIRWEEIRRVEQIHSYAFDCSEFVRLVGSGRSINFTDAIDHYPELMDRLETHASLAPRVRLPRVWLLLLVGGLGGTMPSRSGGADAD